MILTEYAPDHRALGRLLLGQLLHGGPDALRLAQVLLDAGSPEHDLTEIDLESDLGMGGVAPGSNELRLALKGAFSWVADGESE